MKQARYIVQSKYKTDNWCNSGYTYLDINLAYKYIDIFLRSNIYPNTQFQVIEYAISDQNS